MDPEIFLVHQDAGLMVHFQKEFRQDAPLTSVKSIKHLRGNSYPDRSFFVIDTENGWWQSVQKLQTMRQEGKEFYAVIASSAMLKKTAPQIRNAALSILPHGEPVKAVPHKAAPPENPSLQESELHLTALVEKKLSDFVQKVKHCKVANLYSLLIREFEKPILTLALRETKGNQIQAAQLLGINRNTLRKKLKELSISTEKN